MTEPDFPDFQARQTVRGAPLVPFSNYTFTNAGTSFGPVPINNFSGVEAHLVPGSQAMQLTAYFSPDTSIVDALVIPVIKVPVGMHLDVVLPAVGDYCEIVIAAATGASGTTLAYVAPVESGYGGYRFTHPSPELVTGNQIAGISSSTLWTMPTIFAGPVSIIINPLDTAGMLQYDLFTLTAAGAANSHIATFGTPTALLVQALTFPLRPMGLRVNNNDAGATHSYNLTIVPQLAA